MRASETRNSLNACYEGDLNDSDCGSVGDHELDTWEDWCDSAFRNGYGGFPPDTDDPQLPVVFSDQVFWGKDIADPSLILSDCGAVPVSALQVFTDPVVPLIPPDTGRIDRFDNNELGTDWPVFCDFMADL